MTQPPITVYETLHDYSLLEAQRKQDQSGTISGSSPAVAQSRIALVVTALLLAVFALSIAVCTLVYVYLNTAPALVPGAFQNATVIVNARGQIVSVTQSSAPPTVIMMAPGGQQGPVPEASQTNPPAKSASDDVKKPLPWASKSSPEVSSPTSSEGTASPNEPQTKELSPDVSSEDKVRPNEGSTTGVPETEPQKVVENFVKFQIVKFKTGNVDTGWRYADSNATEPEYQWCYYKNMDARTKGLEPAIDLEGEADLEAIRSVGLTYEEYLEARNKCQWYNNKKPASVPQSDNAG
jgi:hypothetical protein